MFAASFREIIYDYSLHVTPSVLHKGFYGHLTRLSLVLFPMQKSQTIFMGCLFVQGDPLLPCSLCCNNVIALLAEVTPAKKKVKLKMPVTFTEIEITVLP